jgi:hypothetical protein
VRNELIPDAAVDDAFHWLHDNADACAEARAHRIYIEEYRKTLKSRIMKEHDSLPISAQEREAYASLRYEEHLEGLKLAVFNDEKMRFLRETKLATIEAWRTAAANRRAQV